jgi:predicted secreted protein
LFTDSRSKQVILVSHCILNQNAKIDRCAWYPGAMIEVSRHLIDSGVGILQMPCPELLCLGLDRQVVNIDKTTVESEDERVALLMHEDRYAVICKSIAQNLVYQISEYQKNGFTVIGLLGINCSPTCGIETRWGNLCEEPGQGVLINALKEECSTTGIKVSMRGIKAKDPIHAVEALNALLQPEKE